MSDTRKVHSQYATDVDEMILDYMICQTSSSFIASVRERSSQDHQSLANEYALQLNMLDSFIEIYRHNHADIKSRSPCSDNLDLKIRLLQFTIASCSPLCENGPYPHVSEDGVLSKSEIAVNNNTTTKFPKTAQDLAKSYQSISLRSLLPEFLYLSAFVSVHVIHEHPGPKWLQLAAEFIFHTAVSSVTLSSDDADNAVPDDIDVSRSLQTFSSWGYHTDANWIYTKYGRRSFERTGLQVDELELINEMFKAKNGKEDDDDDIDKHAEISTEVPDWTSTLKDYKQTFRAAFEPTESLPYPSIATALAQVYAKHPLPAFIALVLDFCEGLMTLFGTPVLAQIEGGMLEGLGLGEEETRELKERVGWR